MAKITSLAEEYDKKVLREGDEHFKDSLAAVMRIRGVPELEITNYFKNHEVHVGSRKAQDEWVAYMENFSRKRLPKDKRGIAILK